MFEMEREVAVGGGGRRDVEVEEGYILFVKDYVGGLDFEVLGWVGGKRGDGLCCGVGEGDAFVYEGDEATTTPACSVLSEY